MKFTEILDEYLDLRKVWDERGHSMWAKDLKRKAELGTILNDIMENIPSYKNGQTS